MTGSGGRNGTGGTTGGSGGTGNAGSGGTAGTTGTGGGATGGRSGTGGTTTGSGGAAGTTGTGGGSLGGRAGTGGTTAGSGGSSTGGAGGAQTPGCGKAGSPKGAQHLDLSVSGRARKYWRWVPPGYDSSRPIPVIFAWHGSGGDGDEVRRTYFYLEPVVKDGAIILYPDGLPVNGGSTGWDLAAEGADVKFFDAMLQTLSQDYCIDLTRVFSTGYSFGGMITYTLACSRGSKLRGIAPTAGAFFGGGAGSKCPTPVPAWIAHGTNDNTVSFSSAQSARDVLLKTNACGNTSMATTPSPCVAYQCPANAPVHWCAHNEGHEWPSFGAKAIWAFFSSL